MLAGKPCQPIAMIWKQDACTPLNLQWSGDIQAIETHLKCRGWRAWKSADAGNMLELFNSDAGIRELPVLPQLSPG